MIKPLILCHSEHMAALHAQGFENSWPKLDFENHMNNPSDLVIGYFKHTRLCGFVIVRIQYDQAEVITILVEETHQGKGIASTLLNAAEQQTLGQGAYILFLEVAKDNVAAIRLYQKANYLQCGSRPGYYRRSNGRVDALLFQKHLK